MILERRHGNLLLPTELTTSRPRLDCSKRRDWRDACAPIDRLPATPHRAALSVGAQWKKARRFGWRSPIPSHIIPPADSIEPPAATYPELGKDYLPAIPLVRFYRFYQPK